MGLSETCHEISKEYEVEYIGPCVLGNVNYHNGEKLLGYADVDWAENTEIKYEFFVQTVRQYNILGESQAKLCFIIFHRGGIYRFV